MCAVAFPVCCKPMGADDGGPDLIIVYASNLQGYTEECG